MELEVLWREAMSRVEGRLSENDFSCWALAMRPLAWRDGRLHAEVPSRIHLEQAHARVAQALCTAIEAVAGRPAILDLSVNRDGARSEPRPRVDRQPFPAAYTFAHFVVGAANAMAYQSAREVAERPAERFNPLFLYGGVGLGKTHLATAIANAVWGGAGRRVALFSAEAFTNDLVRAFRNHNAEELRAELRRTDVLIVDDVQFFAGKERMQEEFFHTFEALHAARKQIVLVSDQPPRDIPNLGARLASRFESGLITDIRRPDLALRLEILAAKARWLNLELPAEVAKLIATKVVSSVRELEGALRRLLAARELIGAALDVPFAQQVLRPFLREPAPRTVEQVQRIVAERYRITAADLVCRKRLERLRIPRQVAMYLARKRTNATYAEIAEGFGGRDHSTVIAAVRSIEQRRAAEPDLAATLEHLEARLGSS